MVIALWDMMHEAFARCSCSLNATLISRAFLHTAMSHTPRGTGQDRKAGYKAPPATVRNASTSQEARRQKARPTTSLPAARTLTPRE